MPELLNKEQKKHDHLYWEIHGSLNVKGFKQATRFNKWKAVRYGDNYHTELYNLEIEKKNEFSLKKRYLHSINVAFENFGD